LIKLQSDFLGPYFVEDGYIVRPMARNSLKLTGELTSARLQGGDSFKVTDLNDDQETWHSTMKEIVYLEANRFLKPADFERFVCLASGAIVCRFGQDAYPRVMELFPQGFDAAMPHVQSHTSLAQVIERSYYRRLAQNHFQKARAIRDGETPRFGMSTDVMTRKS
jgi:hypothetical protein